MWKQGGRRTKGMRGPLLVVAVLAVVLLSACAAGPNPDAGPQAEAGFLLGLWHGVIVVVTFVISLFTDSVSVYEVQNNGNWYDFGFVLGIMIALGGGSRATKRR